MATQAQINAIEKLYYNTELTQDMLDMIDLYLCDGYDNITEKEANMIIKKLGGK